MSNKIRSEIGGQLVYDGSPVEMAADMGLCEARPLHDTRAENGGNLVFVQEIDDILNALQPFFWLASRPVTYSSPCVLAQHLKCFSDPGTYYGIHAIIESRRTCTRRRRLVDFANLRQQRSPDKGSKDEEHNISDPL